MSAGTRIISLRIPAELLELIDREVDDSLFTRPEAPWTRTSLILSAVQEVFAHRERAKRSRQKRQASRRRASPPVE